MCFSFFPGDTKYLHEIYRKGQDFTPQRMKYKEMVSDVEIYRQLQKKKEEKTE